MSVGRIKFGKRADGVIGFWVSRPGKDANSSLPSDEYLVSSSDAKRLVVDVQARGNLSRQVPITPGAMGYARATITHNLGYVPVYLFSRLPDDFVATANSTTVTATRQLGRVPRGFRRVDSAGGVLLASDGVPEATFDVAHYALRKDISGGEPDMLVSGQMNVRYRNGQWIGVSTDGHSVATSTDGVEWSYSFADASRLISAVDWTGSYYFASATRNDQTAWIGRSTNLTAWTWTKITGVTEACDLTWFAGANLLIAYYSSPQAHYRVFVDNALNFGSLATGPGNWCDTVGGYHVFRATSDLYYVSAANVTSAAGTALTAGMDNVVSLAFGSNKFAAFGLTGGGETAIATAPAISGPWTRRYTAAGDLDLTGGAYVGGAFWAPCKNGLLTSADGVSWSMATTAPEYFYLRADEASAYAIYRQSRDKVV